ncbi:MAG TPA: hypothetical protein PLN25_03020 [Deltaproteobacteria bacterium]|nr:hypothetical protein [Deltaproteobacteria bacterium]HQB39868.1 hypothetical protein [Deltaproteobacteria bacterium]
MITATIDLSKARGDEVIMGMMLVDQISSRLPVSMLQVVVIEPECDDRSLPLPFE